MKPLKRIMLSRLLCNFSTAMILVHHDLYSRQWQFHSPATSLSALLCASRQLQPPAPYNMCLGNPQDCMCCCKPWKTAALHGGHGKWQDTQGVTDHGTRRRRGRGNDGGRPEGLLAGGRSAAVRVCVSAGARRGRAVDREGV